ncbi:MAG: N-glycosylase/DNA lyase [Thermoplasmataceae archaeon]
MLERQTAVGDTKMDLPRSTSISGMVRKLMASPDAELINQRSMEFREAGKSSKEFIFGELCFCILTANTSAEMGVATQKAIGLDGFMNYSQEDLRNRLKGVKYRFYNLRSRYIVEAREIIDQIKDLIANPDRLYVRDYLVQNIKGIGYKEASHFLRNIGIYDFAILDKHILKMLRAEYPGISVKVGSRQRYLDTEKLVVDIARSMGMEPGILDLYMWRIATGKIIK